MKNSNYANNNAFGGGYGGQSQSEVGRGYGGATGGGGPYGSSVSSNPKAAGVGGGLNPNAPQFNSDPFVRAPGGQPGVGIRTSPTQSAQQQKFNNNYNTRGQQQYAGVSSQQQQQPQFNLQQLLGSQSINSTLSMLQQQQQQQQAAPPPPGPPDELSFNALGGLTGGKTIKVSHAQ